MLSEVPEGWANSKLGDLVKLEYGKSLPARDRVEGEYPVYGSAGIVGTHNDYLVSEPSIIVGRKGTVGAVYKTNKPFYAIDTTYYVVQKISLDLNWLAYLLQHLKLVRLNEATGVPGLNRDKTYKVTVALPPLTEQKQIAEVLSSVDESIQTTQRLIEQAERVKQGLMEELLTGGLGSEAIERGKVPDGWVVTTVGESCLKVTVGIASSATHAYTSDGVPLLRNQNIKYGFIDDSDLLYVTEEFDEKYKTKRLKTGDVISMRTGYTGASAIIDERFHDCQTFTTLISRPKPELLKGKYLVHWLNSPLGRRLVKQREVGGAQANLNAGTLKQFPLIYPSLNAQSKIIDEIDSIYALILKNETHVTQLRVLKKGLMDDLLTGKVRTV
ncbi:hypothetical protein IDSA_11490 [Pseudidiomarina salinarum]|uniref:Type I restriction modification DNA specificity domain-containing protein n=1 Tax=Pseudidiomarina salinarum TaxID=435908 RepID=A0A094L628_9GAMM|nr:restriction endonuclease subunit S [Pseudidiomarina salinarum]KFZ30178.1 hypothetical protein IDSA_11490 [Pseudidiomarina salinarum]RUO68680.1 restriction endonuclease subunit S [Pseudidiomarina salinarum]